MDSSSSPPCNNNNGTGTIDCSLRPLCDDSMQSLRKNFVLYCAQLAILGTSLISILVLLVAYFRNRFNVHGNLLILFTSIIAVTFLNSLGFFVCILRNVLMFLLFEDPCELLTPLWLSALMLGPTMVYTIAYPAFHFCVMAERVRATLLAKKYEWEGRGLGLWMISVVWLTSLTLVGAGIWLAYLDPEMTSHAQKFASITSSLNRQFFFYLNIFMLLLVIFTAFCDWRVFVLNNRIRATNSHSLDYSLSMNYQLHENALAMRLILPLDVIYALLYSIYQALASLIRARGSVLSPADYIFYYNLANTLLYFYTAVTIIVYIRFVLFVSRTKRRDVKQQNLSMEHAKIYFRQLELQWK